MGHFTKGGPQVGLLSLNRIILHNVSNPQVTSICTMPALRYLASLGFMKIFPLFIPIAALGIPSALLAQDPGTPTSGASPVGAPTPESTASTVSFLNIIEELGWMAYPLLLLSVAALFLVIYYTLTIRRGAVVSDRFMNSVDNYLRKGDYLNLLDVCQNRTDCISGVAEKALEYTSRNPDATFDEIKEVTEAEGIRQANALNHRIAYLADIGAIAPMVGLLGTVLGMIRAFRSISVHVVDQDKKMELASGVSEALFTTAGGLAIGIPALIFYSLFRGKVNRLVSDLEAASSHILTLIAARLDPDAKSKGPQKQALDMEKYYASPYPVASASTGAKKPRR